MIGDNLKHRTVRALAWSFVDKFGQQMLYLLTGVVLARLLSQTDYGLTGMLAIFVALSNVVMDSGFGGALIKKQGAGERDFTAVFYFNIAVSFVLYIIMYLCAPAIARFYNEPQLVLLTRVLFLSLLFNAFNLVQSVILTKAMNFNRLAKINTASLALASVGAVFVALFDGGVWALVVQTVLIALFKSLFLWIFNPWRPLRNLDIEPLKEAFKFSSGMLASGLLNAIFNNIYSVIIGKHYHTAQLGVYQLANKYQEIPTSLVASTFRSVALPLFSSVNDDPGRLRRVMSKSVKSLAFVIFPLVGLLCVVAEPLLVGLVGAKWLSSVPLFRILLLAGGCSVFTQIFKELLVAKGRSRLYFYLEVISKLLLVVAIVVSYSYGITGMAYGWLAYSFATMLVTLFFGYAITGGKIVWFARDVAPYFALSVLFLGLIWSFEILSFNQYLCMILQVIVFVILYCAGVVLLRLDMGGEIVALWPKIKGVLRR